MSEPIYRRSDHSRKYEKFVQDVVAGLLLDQYGDVAPYVEQDKLVRGMSGCRHQIDVYYEQISAYTRLKFAIECKYYASPVEIRHVRDFYAVIKDTGMNGTIITTVGFQGGAKRFGAFYGIKLETIEWGI